ncbi:MAG TPA: AAA family ATPase [Legionella sp.]|nr:AAA family ATPase [Legionella sp.]
MFKRQLTDTLLKAVASFPVTVLTGPRQSGKTTLLRQSFPDFTYVSLESPDQLMMAKADPRGLLESCQQGIIIDEAQNYPDLFSYIQEVVDIGKRPLKIVLSGSQNFLLAEKISQTLAGRAALLELLPLTYAEYRSNESCVEPSLFEFLYHGAYPRPYHENLPTTIWYDSYIRTYLERDVRSIINVRDLSQFQLFLKYCAGQHGQEFNASSIATSLGMSQTNVMHWLSILEASYVVFRLPPFYKNYKKRLSKRSKLYFYDTAIVSHLLGIESPEHLAIHASRGAIFEGFVITEVIKTYYAVGRRPSLYYWREHVGLEVDLLIETVNRLIAMEAKSGMTMSMEQLTGLSKLQDTITDIPLESLLVYAGEAARKINKIEIRSWRDFIAVLGIL